ASAGRCGGGTRARPGRRAGPAAARAAAPLLPRSRRTARARAPRAARVRAKAGGSRGDVARSVDRSAGAGALKNRGARYVCYRPAPLHRRFQVAPPPPMTHTAPARALQRVEDVVIRFAGDSGDGMQLTGDQFTRTTAIMGNDIATLPDFPAEIRAPAGTLPGVSAFQLRFSSHDIHTPGSVADVLVAMIPAALKVHIKELKPGGILIVNPSTFKPTDLKKAKWDSNPLE